MKLHIGQGTTVGAITVFPVWHDGHVRSARAYDTGSATLAVSEADTGPSVPTLQVTNSGEKPVLVLDGQLFEGGMQHRMATRSTLVRAGGRMAIEVACVEQSRWAGTTTQATRGRRANLVVRDGYDAGGSRRCGAASRRTTPRQGASRAPAPSLSASTRQPPTRRPRCSRPPCGRSAVSVAC